jgi:hypothetical protein
MGDKFLIDAALHFVPGLAPIDAAATDLSSDVVNLANYESVVFLCQFGVVTGDSSVITVEECTSAAAAGATARAFHYRKSSAVGTDSVGAFTTAAASGVTVGASDDGKVIAIEVKADELTDGYNFVRVTLTNGASMSVCLEGVVMVLKPKYAQAAQVNAVS